MLISLVSSLGPYVAVVNVVALLFGATLNFAILVLCAAAN
jgi:hypothetical protein